MMTPQFFGLMLVISLFRRFRSSWLFDLLGNGDLIGERHQHQVPSGKGKFGGDPGTFGGDGFLCDLDQDVLVGFEDTGDLSRLLDIFFKCEISNGRITRGYSLG